MEVGLGWAERHVTGSEDELLDRYTQKLASIAKLREEKKSDTAFEEVTALCYALRANPHLRVLRAELGRNYPWFLHRQDALKRDLEIAITLDPTSCAALIGLGHFLSEVENNQKAASEAYAAAEDLAREHLTKALAGQAKIHSQMGGGPS